MAGKLAITVYAVKVVRSGIQRRCPFSMRYTASDSGTFNSIPSLGIDVLYLSYTARPGR